MGMFDTVVLYPPDRERLRCAAGHPLSECQTKDMGEPAMEHYFVFQGKLYRASPGRSDSTPLVVEGGVVLRTDVPAEPVPFTGTALIYGHCGDCQPVLSLGQGHGLSWDMVQEHSPSCEWDARFSAGELVALDPVLVESRDDLRAALAKRGLDVLADDDRIAKRHLALREERGNDGWGPRRGRRSRA